MLVGRATFRCSVMMICLAGGEPVTQGEAFVLAEGHLRHGRDAAFRLELTVAGHRHDVDDHGGALCGGPRVRVEQAGAVGGGVRTAAGHEGGIDDDGLARDVAADEVGLAAHADPDRLGGDAFGGDLRAGRREDRGQIDRLAAGRRVAGIPADRTPVASGGCRERKWSAGRGAGTRRACSRRLRSRPWSPGSGPTTASSSCRDT